MTGALLLTLLAGLPAGTFGQVQRVHPSPSHPEVVFAVRDAPVSSLVVSFDVGSADDVVPGITRLSQHALLEANHRTAYRDFQRALFRADATVTLATSQRRCSFTLVAPSERFDSVARRFLELLLTPNLADGEGFQAAIRRTVADQDEAGTPLTSTLARVLVSDPSFQAPLYGESGLADEVRFNRVRTFVAEHLSPANARVVVAGRFDPGRMRRFLERFKGGERISRARPTIPLGKTRRFIARAEIQVIAIPLDAQRPAIAAQAELASELIEEELEQEFRGAGVGYSFYVEPLLSPWWDALMIILPAHDPSGIDLEPFLRRAVDKVRIGPLSADAFERARGAVLEKLAETDSHPASLAASLATTSASPAWFPGNLAAELEKLTPQGFASGGAWLDPKRGVYLKFGPHPEAGMEGDEQ